MFFPLKKVNELLKQQTALFINVPGNKTHAVCCDNTRKVDL